KESVGTHDKSAYPAHRKQMGGYSRMNSLFDKFDVPGMPWVVRMFFLNTSTARRVHACNGVSRRCSSSHDSTRPTRIGRLQDCPRRACGFFVISSLSHVESTGDRDV